MNIFTGFLNQLLTSESNAERIMKRLKLFFIGIAFLMVSSSLMAQRGGIQKSPEEWATEQTGYMEEQLVLSTAQKEKLYAANLDFANKAKAVREDETIERGMIREKMQELREENDLEVQKYLTQEQWEKWLAFKSEMLEQRFRQNKVKENSKG
ncbi:MAG: hypothetical protein KDC24_03815 [Saprospiraceae bacterium]|nr:hypothetical protein [Saprospiraceae bacterium]